jgi:prophage antirepressor-like protein
MDLIKSIDEAFLFEKNKIRIFGNFDKPLFVAKDICDVLGLSNITEALKHIPEKWMSSLPIKTLTRGTQTMIVLQEPAVYQLIMRSNRPIAQTFREFVCEEILPNLRKKGEYKIQSLIDKNKELETEKKQLQTKQQELETKQQELETKQQKLETEKQQLNEKLIEEQKVVIKTKKSLIVNQKKFLHRHKFTETSGCVYVLQDPENSFNKYKIGFTQDINERLKNDRTMIPNIKVVYIMYTPYYELFEKLIKIKFEKFFQLQSEWIWLNKFENVQFIIDGLHQIKDGNGFTCKIEEELWKYNLEEPPNDKVILNIEDEEKLFDKSKLNTFAGKLSSILPSFLIRGEYEKKNETAPFNYRYCNGFCQNYVDKALFDMRSISPLTICMKCNNMIDIANVKINNNILTPEEIRKNPSLLNLGDNERICRKCLKIKNKDEFPEKRRQCKDCRNKVRSKFGKDFDDKIEEEIRILNEIPMENKESKINYYTKDELQKIVSFLKIGRKYNDTKDILCAKIIDYYKK